MQEESSTFGLNHEKLARLWRMGERSPEDPDALGEQGKAEVLQAQLAESLPLEAGMARMLPDILTLVCEKLKPFTGCSFRELLMDPDTDLLVLKTIKDVHKRHAESGAADSRQAAATVIYYAAIASALVHHDVRITKLSYESLSRSFAELRSNDWLSTDIQQLLGDAHRLCLQRTHKSEK